MFHVKGFLASFILPKCWSSYTDGAFIIIEVLMIIICMQRVIRKRWPFMLLLFYLCKEVLKEVTVLLRPEIAKYQSTCYGLFMSVLSCKVNSDLVMMYNAKINKYLMCRWNRFQLTVWTWLLSFFILLAQKAAETKLWQLHGETLSFSPLLLILVGLHLRWQQPAESFGRSAA